MNSAVDGARPGLEPALRACAWQRSADGLDEALLSDDEAAYVGSVRAANARRGHRSDHREWAEWCHSEGFDPVPASPTWIRATSPASPAMAPRSAT